MWPPLSAVVQTATASPSPVMPRKNALSLFVGEPSSTGNVMVATSSAAPQSPPAGRRAARSVALPLVTCAHIATVSPAAFATTFGRRSTV